MNIVNRLGRTQLQLSHHTSHLGAADADAMARAFRNALAAVFRDAAHQTLDTMQILDRDQLDAIYATNSQPPPRQDGFVHDAICARCLASPDADAVCAWDGAFTYRQLHDQSLALAQKLVLEGAAGPESTVPILLEKTRWTPVAMLAVLRAGASFVLMDASQPLARLSAMVDAVRPRAMISSAQTRPKALRLTSNVIDVTCCCSSQQTSNVEMSSRLQQDHAAYVVFTSGSTGTPKGAVVEHASLSAAAAHLAPRLQVSPASRVLQFSSHAWDVPLTDVLVTLYAGGCVCIASDDERTGDLAAAANRMRVTSAFLTPTVARLLRPRDLTYLQTLVLGGEALSSADLATWCDEVCLIQAYGPAECGLATTVTERLTGSDDPRDVGFPNGCAVWVVDRHNHELLAPPGAVGELLVEGPVVARGYVGEADKTRAVFVQAPVWLRKLRVGREDDIRLYKTGDLVRQDVGGGRRLVFCGRKDDQIKIRGQRTEPGEVEAQVARVFAGCQVVVLAVKREAGTVLVGLVLQQEQEHRASEGENPGQPSSAEAPSPTAEAEGGDVRLSTTTTESETLLLPPSPSFADRARTAYSRLRDLVPAYMLPSFILPLARLPKGPTGKADRHLLRRRVVALTDDELDGYTVASHGSSRHVAATPQEARLQELVGQVMQRPAHAVPLDEDLFTFGLDSLTAMTLATAARARRLDLSVPTIFQHPRLTDLALVLDQQQKSGKEANLLTPAHNPVAPFLDEICSGWHLDKHQVVHAVPTTYYQQGALAARHAAFVGLDLSRPLDPRRLRAAVAAMVLRHSILRTAFVPFGESWVQLALREYEMPWEEIAFTGDVPESLFREADANAAEFGVPHTKLVLRLDDQGACRSVLLRLHRAQFDGIAITQIIAELRSAMAAASSSSSSPPLDYGDFVLARNAQNTPRVFDMWRDLLQGSSMTYLFKAGEYLEMTDRDRAADRLATSSCDVTMPRAVQGFTMATVAKASWALCLARRTRSRDVVFMQLVRNRHLAVRGIDTLVGSCINYIPVRAGLQPHATARDLFRQLHQQHVHTMAGDAADWSDVVARSTSWARDTGFGSAIHYLSAPVAPTHDLDEGISCELHLHEDKMTHTFPMLTCIPFPGKDGVEKQLKIILTAAVCGQGVTDELLATFRETLQRVTTNPAVLVADLLEG